MKKIFLSLALILLVAAGCGRVNDNRNQDQAPAQNEDQNAGASLDTEAKVEVPVADDSGRSPAPSGEADIDVTPMPEVFEVKITSSGFVPAQITIQKGDYIQFTNTDSEKSWPASDPHPTHTGLAGFDAGKGLNEGEKFRFQFNTVGSWSYHDHPNVGTRGTIIVK